MTQRVMLATVGLSPVPVVLSVLTVAPDVVVLLHSDGSEREARRIRLFVTGRSDVVVKMFPVGSGHDFPDIHSAVVAAIGQHVPADDAFVLGYSGGTAAMVACAVRVHHRAHGGRPDLRGHVDDSSGTWVTDDGAEFALSEALSLADLAGLHGFTLDGRVIRTPSTPPDPALTSAAWDARAHDDPSGDELTAALEDSTRWRRFDADAPAEPLAVPDGPDPEQRRALRLGFVTEMCHLAGLLDVEADEIAHAVRFRQNRPGATEVGEFDLVVRRGRRVVVVEVKSSAFHALRASGKTLVLARSVFGSTARTAVAGPVAEEGRERLRVDDQIGQWNHLLPELARLSWFESGGTECAVTGFGDWLEPELATDAPPGRRWRCRWGPRHGDPAADPPTAGAFDPTAPVDKAVTVVGGTGAAVQSALALPAREQQLVGTKAALDMLPPGLEKRITVHDSTARQLAERLTPGSRLVVTPGPKAGAAAMAATDDDLVHIDVGAGRAHSWRHGSAPHRPAVDWGAISNPAFGPAVSAGWWSPLGRTHDAAVLRRVVDWARSVGAGVWFGFDPTAPWWVPVLLTGPSRALGVVCPVERDDAARRRTALAAATHLYALIGDAGRMLVLLEPSERERLVLWRTPYRDLPTPLIGFTDVESPGLYAQQVLVDLGLADAP